MIPGVDEPLPEGEALLWQGRPSTAALARHAFKVRWVAAYFVALAALAFWAAAPGEGVARASWMLVLGLVTVGLVTGWAWLVARTSVYALTDRRIVMRIGVAFPAVFNLPLELVGDAWIRTERDGSGDIALALDGSDRIGYLFLWPHVRPWRLRWRNASGTPWRRHGRTRSPGRIARESCIR